MTQGEAPAAFPVRLVREDLRDFTGYSSARTSDAGVPARVWLNANESGAPSTADPTGSARRYPDPQPRSLVQALAEHYAVDPAQVVVGRGSDEAIELLVRTLCRPGGDGVVITSPTFGMYAVSARLHGVPVTDVAQLDAGHRWHTDLDAVEAATRRAGARVVFLASPGNPTGSTLPLAAVAALTARLADQAVVVLDEAYAEFAGTPSMAVLLARHPTLVVLRTLSKAHALAGARVGVALTHPNLAAVLRRVQAPYPVPRPVSDLAVSAMTPAALRATAERVATTRRLRDRLATTLQERPGVLAVYDSEANFVLVRTQDPDELLATLRAAGVVVRDMRHLPGLADAVRITVGTPDEMDTVRTTLLGETA